MADFGPDGLCLRFGRRDGMAAAAGIEAATVNAPTSRDKGMYRTNTSIRTWFRFLKPPALVFLILAGFILEFVVELPFRLLTAIAGGRRRP
jgi:hypothetical protein